MKRSYLYLGGVVVVVAVVVAFLWQRGSLGGDRALLRSISDKPELVALFEKTKETGAKIKETPDDAALYLDLGLTWKSIAELTDVNQPAFFERTLTVYERGIERFGEKNILFYLNAGKVAARVEQYGKAEKYFRKAIEISPGDESGYLDLVDLYYYRLKKGPEEILPIFEAGLKTMVNTSPLIAGRATYLRRIGDNENALKDYQKLVKIFPAHPGYQEIVEELTEKINVQ